MRISKKNIYTKLSVLFLVLGCLIALVFSIMLLSHLNKGSSDSSSSKADGFTIKSFKIVMDVKRNGMICVDEEITVDFYETGHHGIIRSIPEWLEYTDKTGKTMSRKAVISCAYATGDKYTTATKDGKLKIKIGDAGKTLPTGPHTYFVSYRYDMGGDPYEGFDEFIFHAFGDFWGTRINNAVVEIHMPEEIDPNSDLRFFADKNREKDVTSFVDYTISGDTIVAKLSPDYELDKALTVDLTLPEGYFASGVKHYGITSLTICFLCIAFAVFSFVLWIFFGKDKKRPASVEFYPPENYDAAQIGYLYKQSAGKKLSIALIIALAGKGFLRIIESDDRKITVIKNTEKNLQESDGVSENEKLIYNVLFASSDEVMLSSSPFLLAAAPALAVCLKNDFDDVINDLKAYRSMLISSAGFALCSFLFGLAYTSIEDMDPKYSILYFLGFAAVAAIFVFSILMKRKSDYGERIKARILGFRNFIEVAKKDQIDMLVEQNPNYFFDILPYAYALDVTSKWVERFEYEVGSVEEADSFDFYNIGAYADLTFSANRSSFGSSSGSSSSSSCGGGGCSSCGGGCSSCGGGSSW